MQYSQSQIDAYERSGRAMVVLFAGIVLYIALFFWQRGFLPQEGVIQHMSWWKGFFHGFYAGLNFLFNLFSGDKSLDIYQTGAGAWYQFWFLFGLGTLGSGASRASRRW